MIMDNYRPAGYIFLLNRDIVTIMMTEKCRLAGLQKKTIHIICEQMVLLFPVFKQ